jgi:hypothetical protein
VKQVLLGQLEQEIRAQPDVEIDVALRCLGLRDVQVQGLIEELDSLLLILLLPPANDCLEVCVV